MILPTRSGNTEGGEDAGSKLRGGKPKPTVDEIVSDGCTVTQAVVVDVATLTIEVFSDRDEIAGSCSGANVREKLSTGTLEANLFEGLQS